MLEAEKTNSRLQIQKLHERIDFLEKALQSAKRQIPKDPNSAQATEEAQLSKKAND